MSVHLHSPGEVVKRGRRASGEERQEWMSLEGTCQTGRLRHSKRRARWTAAVWAPVALALALVVGRAGCFAPGEFSRPLPASSVVSGMFCALLSCPLEHTFPRRFLSLQSVSWGEG